MPAKTPHLVELGQFFKERRSRITPAQAGLPERGHTARRVSGLRREEVAELASISHDYYTRIEQGRLAPSDPVLEVLIRVLRLDADQATYVRSLAQQADRRTPPRPRSPKVRPQLMRLMDQLTDTPALILGRYLDILAWNRLASTLLVDFDALPADQRNYVRLMFLNPHMRSIYQDWETVARTSVSFLRMEAAENPTDPRLAALVGRLSVADEDFRVWWAERNVASQEFGSKTLHNETVGDLTLDWDSFRYSGDPSQQLVLWSAEEGSPSAEKLALLASWSVRVPEHDRID
ncbi:MAG: helix-turn-helix transcriptional regulator [Gordonia sp. (in: high G+C Gram-positive bacteria)]|uniref:helix-turn-helix domain-containing protein n=1 Tax=Gordonia sp. (in: high G+C Gram-positive bacteria) TaxID=84139 RepID=UPI0039E6DCDB